MIKKKHFFKIIKSYNDDLKKLPKQEVINSNLEQARIIVNQNNEINFFMQKIKGYQLLIHMSLTLLSSFMILVFAMNFDTRILNLGDFFLLIGGIFTFLFNFPPILKDLLT